jgi:hypothetical protein
MSKRPDENPKLTISEDIVEAGKEHVHFLPWGALMSAYAQQRVCLWIVGSLLAVSIIGNIILALQYTEREIWVFVKDHLGQVVQADKESFLRAGNKREDNEIKGFVLRFCRDAYEFTPLNVSDNIKLAMTFVEPKAQTVVSDGLRFAERAQQVSEGMSVKIEDDIQRGKVPEISILRREPLEVLIVFGRVGIPTDGRVRPLQPIAVQLALRLVPRSPHNPNGLVVVGLTTTNT